MAQEGQQVPLVAVAEKNKLLLLDGYARLKAAHQCGWDQAWVEVWSRGLETGLARILAENQGRRWDAVEEGYLLREWVDRGGRVREIASRLGKAPSWVSRGLQILQRSKRAIHGKTNAPPNPTRMTDRFRSSLTRWQRAQAALVIKAFYRC